MVGLVMGVGDLIGFHGDYSKTDTVPTPSSTLYTRDHILYDLCLYTHCTHTCTM